MRTTLVLPDGSAFDGGMVAGIRWTKAISGESYARKAQVIIDTYRDDSLSFGFSRNNRTIGQYHACEMESDDDAKAACTALVGAWTGRALETPPEPV